MTEEEYKTFVYTQLNTKINSENLVNSKDLSNLHHKDIFGKDRRGSVRPLKRTKLRKNVSFSDNVYFD